MVAIEETSSQGGMTAEITCASKKERQFQVVHVPGVFTRGRWKCWDYREENAQPEKMLEFSEKENSSDATTGLPMAVATASVAALNDPVQTTLHSPSREQSSTILVTSIAPAPPTPQHGTPGSISEMASPPYSATGDESRWQTEGGSAAAPTTPEMVRSATESTPMEEEPSSVTISNVVAIDNKIEQAMDLVKTHLTFAVREEVDVLRQTIAELETKVTTLETQNTYLRRFVPADVLANLPVLVAAHKASTSQQQPPAQAAAAQQHNHQMPAAPLPFCAATSNFASTLSTVVPSPQPPHPR